MICEGSMADDNFYMKQALQEARKAFEKGEVPVGAVVVCRDRIIARSYNLTETLTDVTAHAEMQAITAAANYLGGKYLNDCTLYVTVEPCVMCAGAIAWSQMGSLVFGAADEKEGISDMPPGLASEDSGSARCLGGRLCLADERFLQETSLINLI